MNTQAALFLWKLFLLWEMQSYDIAYEDKLYQIWQEEFMIAVHQATRRNMNMFMLGSHHGQA